MFVLSRDEYYKYCEGCLFESTSLRFRGLFHDIIIVIFIRCFSRMPMIKEPPSFPENRQSAHPITARKIHAKLLAFEDGTNESVAWVCLKVQVAGSSCVPVQN